MSDSGTGEDVDVGQIHAGIGMVEAAADPAGAEGRPFGAPRLDPISDRKMLRTPDYQDSAEVLRSVAQGHEVRLDELRGVRRRFVRDRLWVTVTGDPMDVAAFWHDAEEVLVTGGPGWVERAFSWLVAWSD